MSRVTDLVKEKTDEAQKMFEGNVHPQSAAILLVQLSSLLASLNAEITDAHFKFNEMKALILTQVESVAKAKVQAEASPVWKDFMFLLNSKESLVELVRAVKYYLKSAVEEMKEFSQS